MGSLLVQQLFIWEPLNIPRYNSNKMKRNSEKHTEIFLEFLVFFRKKIKGKNKNEKNYLHGKAPNKQKKNKEIFLGFLFSTTANYSRKKNQKEKQDIFLYFLKVFQTHKKKARKWI